MKGMHDIAQLFIQLMVFIYNIIYLIADPDTAAAFRVNDNNITNSCAACRIGARQRILHENSLFRRKSQLLWRSVVNVRCGLARKYAVTANDGITVKPCGKAQMFKIKIHAARIG